MEESTIFKRFIEKDKHLSEIAYYKDTLLVKLIKFRCKGDTSEIINYSYNDQNLLVLENYIKKNGYYASCKIVYTYDSLGRILSKGLYYSTRLDHIFKYYYDIPNIAKQTYEGYDGKIRAAYVDEYKEGKIVKSTSYNITKWRGNSGKENRKGELHLSCFETYEYDEQNRLIKEFRSAYNKGRPLTIKYIYITK